MNTDRQGFFRDMKQLGEEYVQERLNLLKLQSAEKAARMSAVLVTGIVVGLLLFFVLLFISLMLVYFIFSETHNWYISLGTVAFFYFFIAIIILLIKRNKIYPVITNAVIRILFEKNASENE